MSKSNLNQSNQSESHPKKRTASRSFWSSLFLLLVLAWLLLSYIPASMLTLPTIALPTEQHPTLFKMLALISLGLLVILQSVLVGKTPKIVKSAKENGFTLGMKSEFFWTAIPLLTTIGLILYIL